MPDRIENNWADPDMARRAKNVTPGPWSIWLKGIKRQFRQATAAIMDLLLPINTLCFVGG